MQDDSFWEEPETMTYQNVVIIREDPKTENFIDIRGLKLSVSYEADLVLVKRDVRLGKSGLKVTGMVAEKDRYGATGRLVSSEELQAIIRTAPKVTEVKVKITF